MSENLGDVVVQLRADFGDVQKQFDSLMEKLSDTNARTDEGKATISALSSAFEAVLPNIESFKDANAGAAESAADFISSLDRGIDERFGATTVEEATSAFELHKTTLEGTARASAELDAVLGDTSGGFKSAEEMTKGQQSALERLKESYRQTTQSGREKSETDELESKKYQRIRNEQERVEVSWTQALAEQKKMQADAEKKLSDEMEEQKKKQTKLEQDWAEAIKENEVRANAFGESIANFIENPFKSAADASRSFITAIGPMGVVLLAASAGIYEVGKQLFDLVLAEGEAAESTKNMSLKLNISYDDTKKLSEMAKVAGVDIGILTRVSMRLASALEDSQGSGKGVALALKDMGIYASDSGELLLKFLQHLAEIPDATTRIAEATKVMGRGAVQLTPLIADYKNLSETIEALGGKLSNEMVEALLKADDAADLLTISWSHFKEAIAGTFAPAVMEGLTLITRMLNGPPVLGLEAQLAVIKKEIVDLEIQAKSSTKAVTSMMGGGAVSGQAAAGVLAQKRAQAELLQGQIDAAKRSKEYNDEIAKSNAAAAALKVPYAQMKQQIDAQAAHEKAMLGLKRSEVEEEEKLGLISAEQNLPRLQALNEQEFQITKKAIDRKIAYEKTSKEAEKDLSLNAQMQAARDALAAKDLALVMHVAAEKKKASDSEIEHEGQNLNKQAANARKVAEQREKIDEELRRDEEKADDLRAEGSTKHKEALLETEKAVGNASVAAYKTSIFQKIEMERQLYEETVKLQRDALEAKLQQLDEVTELDVREASKRQAILNQIQALEDAASRKKQVSEIEGETAAWKVLHAESDEALQNQIVETGQAIEKIREMGAPMGTVLQAEMNLLEMVIRLKQARGESSQAELIQLRNTEMATDALIAKSRGLADVYVGFTRNIEDAFSTLGSEFVQAASRAKTFGEAAKSMGVSIYQSFLSTIVNGALHQVSAAILGQIAKWGVLAAFQKTSAATTATAHHTAYASMSAATAAYATAASTSHAAVAAAAAASSTAIVSAVTAAMVAQHAAIATANVAAVLSYSAVAEAAAIAAYAGIPFVGLALGLAAAAAEMAAILPLAGLAAAAEGGTVMSDGAAIIHKGETIVTASGTGTLEKMLQKRLGEMEKAGQGGVERIPTADLAGNHWHFESAIFNGVTKNLVKDVMTQAVKGIRAPLGAKRNF